MLEKIQGCLMGVCLGDALGAPFEILTPQQILDVTHGRGVLGFHKSQEKKRLHATTDDYQLTAAIGKSIIRRRGFDLTDIALAHVEASEETTYGWGGSTRDGVEQLEQYFSSLGVVGRSPHVAPMVEPDKGMGNGPTMKIAPVAILEAIRHPIVKNTRFVYSRNILVDLIHLEERVAAISRLTHSDARSWSAAYAVAWVLCEALLFSNHADFLATTQDKRIFLDKLIKKVTRFETKHEVNAVGSFSERLQKLSDEFLYGPIEKLRDTVGTGCVSLESVCFSIAMYLRHTRDFKKGLLETIACGGDVDTNCAIVGSMIGATVGIKALPVDWIGFNSDFQKANQLGQNMYSSCSK